MIPDKMPIIKRSSQSAYVNRPSEGVRGETFPAGPGHRAAFALGDGVDGQAILYDISFQLVIFDEKNRSCSAR